LPLRPVASTICLGGENGRNNTIKQTIILPCYAALPPLLMSIRSLPETLGGRLFYQQKVVGSGKPQKAGYSFSRRVECVLAM